MRSLHLPMVIANNSVVMSKYLNRMGINTKALSFFKTRLGYEADINLNLDDLSMKERDKKIAEYADYFFEKEVHNYEIFHFHFMSTLSNSNALGGWDIYPERGQYWDLKRLHDMGKKVVLYCVGSEIRNNSRFVYSQMKFCYPTLSIPHPPLNTRHQYKQIWNIIQHADAVVCGDSEVMNNIPYATLAPIPIDTDYMDGFVRQISPDEPMRVLHAPTSQAIKGTDIVLNILHQIQKKHPGLFEIKHIENCTYEEALAQYPGRGPAVDQINQSYGLFALEAMYLGMPVICSLRPEFYRKDDVKLRLSLFLGHEPQGIRGIRCWGWSADSCGMTKRGKGNMCAGCTAARRWPPNWLKSTQALWSDKAVPSLHKPQMVYGIRTLY